MRGNIAVPSGQLTPHLALSESGRWFFGLNDPQTFDPDTVPSEAARLERIYRSLGYHQARVLKTFAHEHDGRTDVTFVVDEGPPTHMTRLTFDGLQDLEILDQKLLTRDLPLRLNGTLSEEAYDQTRQQLRERLNELGYLHAQVTGQAEVQPHLATAQVSFAVTPGPRIHISKVIVQGAQATSQDRIVLESGLSKGDWVTPQLLAKARRQVSTMGIFSLVRVEPGAEERAGEAPVVVTVYEAPFISRELAAGLTSDPYRSVAQVRGEWRHRNLGGRQQQLTLGAGLGYAVLPGLPPWILGGNITQQGWVGHARVELVQPRVRHAPVDALLAADYAREFQNAFSFQRIGMRVGLPIRLNQWVPGMTFTPGMNYDWYFNVTQNGDIPVGIASSFASSGCGAAPGTMLPDSQCIIGAVEGRLLWDKRDNPINTHAGWYLQMSAQYAGLPGSAFDYIRLAPELRGFLPLGSRAVLAGRFKTGMLFKTSATSRALPGVAKFFAGGASSVRVAGAQQLGPRDYLVEANDDFRAGRDTDCTTGRTPCKDIYIVGPPLPTGGNRLLEASVELRLPTPWESLDTVLFMDAGAVSELAEESRQLLPDGEFVRYGVGIGLRLQTPVGPIRLDLAQRLQSWTETPRNLRVAPGTTLTTPANVKDYAFSTDCRAAGYPSENNDARWHQCFNEGGILTGLQLFLTIGEAF